MRFIRIYLLSAFLLAGALKGKCQYRDTTVVIFNLDFLRSGFFLFQHAGDFQGNINFYFRRRVGIKLGGGYGYYGSGNVVDHNFYDFRSQGYFLKPGLLIASVNKDFHIELNYCYSNFKDRGNFVIHGPYWGDLITPVSIHHTQVFFEFYAGQVLLTRHHFSFESGLGLDILKSNYNDGALISPVYVPGFGIFHPAAVYLSGTLNFRMPESKARN